MTKPSSAVASVIDVVSLNSLASMLQKQVIQTQRSFLRRQWFLLTLAVVLAVGMGFAPALEPLQQITWLKWAVVSVTMFLIVWPFSFGKLTETLMKPQAALLATVINSVAMPLAIWPFALLVGNEIGAAMVVAFAAPCTVVSAAVCSEAVDVRRVADRRGSNRSLEFKVS